MLQTTNYNLSQWEAEDRILRTDFNSDNAKIDTALHAQAAALASETEARQSALEAERTAWQAAVAALGNCRIAAGSYVGTGSYGSAEGTKLTFSFAPKLVVVQPVSGACPDVYNDSMKDKVMLLLLRPVSRYYLVGGTEHGDILWGENSVSWRSTKNAAFQMNLESLTYHYVALG